MEQISLQSDRELWERQAGESEKMYGRFAMYRDLGKTRTVRQCAELVNIAHGTAFNLATKYRWRERAEAWDREQDRAFVAELAAKRKDLIEKEARIANGFLKHVIDRLNKITPEQMATMNLDQLARVANLSIGWLRDAYGAPDRRTLADVVMADAAAYEPRSTEGMDESKALTELARLHEENAAYLRLLGGGGT